MASIDRPVVVVVWGRVVVVVLVLVVLGRAEPAFPLTNAEVHPSAVMNGN